MRKTYSMTGKIIMNNATDSTTDTNDHSPLIKIKYTSLGAMMRLTSIGITDVHSPTMTPTATNLSRVT